MRYKLLSFVFLLAVVAGAGYTPPAQSTTVVLTDSQLKNVITAPVVIVPAPGVGRMIRVRYCSFYKPPFITAYGTGSLIGINYAGASVACFNLNTALANTQAMTGQAATQAFSNPAARYDNTPIVASVLSGAAPITLGAAGNTVIVTVVYTVEWLVPPIPFAVFRFWGFTR